MHHSYPVCITARPPTLSFSFCSGTSPVTQAPLAHAMLVPNEAAKAAVMNFLRSQVGV